MKKLLLTAIVFGMCLPNVIGQDDMLEGGGFIHIGYFMPTKAYGSFARWGENKFKYEADVDATKYGPGIVIQFGNIFPVKEFDNGGAIAVRATWLEAAGATYKYEYWGSDSSETAYVGHISPLKCGPQFSYVFQDDMAFDAYYQASGTMNVFTNSSYDVFSVGLTHSFGVAYRYKGFNIGAEYALGNIRDTETDKDTWGGVIKTRTNNFKFIIGGQF